LNIFSKARPGPAIEELRRAYEAREPFLILLPGYPELDRLRADPDLARLDRSLRRGRRAVAS
jgi:hypothetical protein